MDIKVHIILVIYFRKFFRNFPILEDCKPNWTTEPQKNIFENLLWSSIHWFTVCYFNMVLPALFELIYIYVLFQIAHQVLAVDFMWKLDNFISEALFASHSFMPDI